MTKLLEDVLRKASTLSEEDQDALAAILLEELASEDRWLKAFEQSQGELSKLADEALEEFKLGRTKLLDTDKL